MKHLIAKEHHRHLKKRAILELVGLCALVILSFDQRNLISTALNALRQSDLLYVMLMIFVYWLLLPLTSISFRVLINKPLSMPTTILAQLAGAGPGRVIPGGLGHITLAAAHIAKSGNKLRKAIAVPVTNNIVGLCVNMVLVAAAVLTHPTLLSTIADAISPLSIIFTTSGVLAVLTLIQWLSHARSTKKTIRIFSREWRSLLLSLLRRPDRLAIVVTIATTITAGHIALLMLAGNSLNVHITASDALIALSVGILMGGAVPTPGGFGAVEAGTITALIILGYESSAAVSVALLFRAVTYWMPLIPGLFAYLYLRERKLI